ncbi:MAG: hypothetical protein LC776_01970 [Acidobacteria bacterium]|nr:hypothetical protein [Acidobacteriota bacterium]
MGCTTTEEIRRADGTIEYLIACGAGLGWNICYDKANEVCPSGYTTLLEEAGFNRKELRIACPDAKRRSDETSWDCALTPPTSGSEYGVTEVGARVNGGSSGRVRRKRGRTRRRAARGRTSLTKDALNGGSRPAPG